jgi:hypothetical protein
MNFIAKKIHWIGLLLLVGFTTAAAALYFDAPAKAPKAKPAPVNVSAQYVCPMHPEVVSAKPGNCSKCGMALVLASKISATEAHAGCGSENEGEAHGCCGKKETAAELPLPPGHPPVAGYTVQSACDHSGGSATNVAK